MKKHPYWTKYSASENGSVYGVRGNELTPILHNSGYTVITVRDHNAVQKQVRIHRFVWECLVGAIPKGMVINHKNGIKTDNRLENLEVVTNQENTVHCWEHLNRVSVKGEDKTQAKISENDAMKIIKMCKEGRTNKELGMMFDLHPNYISLIRHGKRWKHLPR